MIFGMSKSSRRYTNQQLVEIFQKIANLLEIKGEVIYKTLAYRKAADSISNLGRDVTKIWEADQLTEIPGVGKAIAEKIADKTHTSTNRVIQDMLPYLQIAMKKNKQLSNAIAEEFELGKDEIEWLSK